MEGRYLRSKLPRELCWNDSDPDNIVYEALACGFIEVTENPKDGDYYTLPRKGYAFINEEGRIIKLEESFKPFDRIQSFMSQDKNTTSPMINATYIRLSNRQLAVVTNHESHSIVHISKQGGFDRIPLKNGESLPNINSFEGPLIIPLPDNRITTIAMAELSEIGFGRYKPYLKIINVKNGTFEEIPLEVPLDTIMSQTGWEIVTSLYSGKLKRADPEKPEVFIEIASATNGTIGIYFKQNGHGVKRVVLRVWAEEKHRMINEA